MEVVIRYKYETDRSKKWFIVTKICRKQNV